MDKIIYFVMFLFIGSLSYGWWSNRQIIIEQKNENIAKFMAKGKRFTAKDGQILCERIADLEQNVGMSPRPCDYEK